MRKTLLIIILSIFVLSCNKTATEPVSDNAKHYPLKGKIVSVNRAAKTAKIDHDEVPGLMTGMTMDFPIHADFVWDELKPGAEIRADLVVDNTAKDPSFLENISIVAAPDPNKPAVPINEKFAQIGLPVPDFRLTNQDGKPISIKEFHGKALAITFIYRECPLPDFCIKMSRNFSDLANQLADDTEAQKNIRLLSISFDPARDTPEKLREYGKGYLGNAAANFNIWQLAVGSDSQVRGIADFFGLRYETDENDKTLINHSLITAVISPDGKVSKIITGNDWTPSDLLRELQIAVSLKK